MTLLSQEVDQAKQLKVLLRENNRLKRVLADEMLGLRAGYALPAAIEHINNLYDYRGVFP